MAHRIQFPRRLLASVRWVAILSDGEARACIRDYRAGLPYSGEAVNHYGGTRAVLCRASARDVRKIMRVVHGY